MHAKSRVTLWSAVALACAAVAADQVGENPITAQFRRHLSDADQNKDGFVTREELTAEIRKDPQRDSKTIAQIVSAMISDLDADRDGKLSAVEVAEGAQSGREWRQKGKPLAC